MRRYKDIERIVSGLRADLRAETHKALHLCADTEIADILTTPEAAMCLEIEHIFIKMVLQNRIEESSIPGWDIRESMLYEVSKEKYLPDIRNDKIDKLMKDDNKPKKGKL